MKKQVVKRKWFLLTGLVLLLFFALTSLLRQNYEFMIYSLVSFVLVLLVYFLDRRFAFPPLALGGFLVWLFLHFGGGFFHYHGTRWYSLTLLPLIGEPYGILGYDQVLHFFFYLIMAVFVFKILRTFCVPKVPKSFIFFVTVLAATGIGAFNEIIELGVAIYDPTSGIGSYINNALDLVFNLLGAVVGAWWSLRQK